MSEDLYSSAIEVEITSPDEVSMDGTAYIGDGTIKLETYDGVEVIITYEGLKKLVSHVLVEEKLEEILDIGW